MYLANVRYTVYVGVLTDQQNFNDDGTFIFNKGEYISMIEIGSGNGAGPTFLVIATS